jgi:enamine deaminase RidA (YjgF/YER057c/UK114 family)
MSKNLGRPAAIGVALLILALCVVQAQTPAPGPAISKVTRIPIPNSDFPISQGVWIPAAADTLYLSGSIPPVANTAAPKGSVESFGNTEMQTTAVLQRIEQTLEAQKLTLADVVMMHVYLVGDPSKENKMDFAGFMAGYIKFFGTKEQPNKPSRSAMQVAALAAPGALVEIEVIAVRPHQPVASAASTKFSEAGR